MIRDSEGQPGAQRTRFDSEVGAPLRTHTPLPTSRRSTRAGRDRWFDVTGRLGDLLIALLLLGFMLPLLTLTALAVRVEGPGPILVWQQRIGSDGRLFNALRFRTNRAYPLGIEWFRRDQRSRVGEYLWRTRLDGMPMLINVLRGEMTILGVGNRTRLLR